MRTTPVVLAGLLFCLPAVAQVTTNDGALDSLSAPRTSKPRTHRPTRSRTAAPPQANHAAPPASDHIAPPAAAHTAPAAKPAISATPPAILALPPAVVVPLAHPPPAPAVPLADDAPGIAEAIPNGIRVTFGADRADLNPATADALTRFAGGITGPDTAIHIFAYAAGSSDDPSTPRRLSLQRALTARAVLMKAGIASPRIYPRALGPASGDQPDRIDVVTGTAIPPPAGRPG